MTMPIPGSHEDIVHSLNELQKQFEKMIHALRDTAVELQLLRRSYDEMSDHCAILVRALWEERGQSERLRLSVEWFQSLVESREKRMQRDTPPDGTRISSLPPEGSGHGA
jgi:hypothetical protein